VGIQEAWLPVSQKRLQQGYVAARLRKPKEASVLFLEHDRGAGPTTDDTRLNSLTLVGSVQQPLPNGAYRRLIQLNYAPQPKATQGVYLSELIRAEEAKWDVRRQAWHLRQGTSYMLDAQGVFLAAHNFQQRWLHTHPALYPLVRLSRESPGDARFDRLARYIALLRQGGQWQNVPFFELRLFQKITLPLAPLVFVVLGALFGLEPLRSHRAVGVTLGTAVLFLYSVAIPLTTHVGSAGIVAPWLLATLPLALAMAAALLLLRLKARLEQQH
jgi:lipopolysaccharide export LptBFGC system permease protein LptF